MKTPAGTECKYFYADYFRGKEKEECRLLASASPPLAWKAQMCFTCPVPEILLANACPYMVLHPRLGRSFPFIRQQVQIRAYCTKTERGVAEPHIGCGECHPLPFALPGDPGETDTSS
jgi:hypothetical protein